VLPTRRHGLRLTVVHLNTKQTRYVSVSEACRTILVIAFDKSWVSSGTVLTERPPRTTNARMSSLQAPTPNTGGTVHVVSAYRAALSPPLQCLPVQDCPCVRCLETQARMSEEATYAFNEKCAVHSRQHVSRCDAIRYAGIASASIRCPRLNSTYKIPEKQKILPIPNRTLKMIGTAERSVSISMKLVESSRFAAITNTRCERSYLSNAPCRRARKKPSQHST